MKTLSELNPLKSLTIPNVGKVDPKGLTLIIGPNSSGKTQLLKDIQMRILGKERNLVVCEDIEISWGEDYEMFLGSLMEMGHIRRSRNEHGTSILEYCLPHLGSDETLWTTPEQLLLPSFDQKTVSNGINGERNRFLEFVGRSFLSSLFLDRRLTLTSEVDAFDSKSGDPKNELQALQLRWEAQELLNREAVEVFGKSICLNLVRGVKIDLRVGFGPDLPSPEDRLNTRKMASYRQIEEEGDGFRSYMATCIAILLGQRPVVLIDEPELCLHPPQAYALGKFIGKNGVFSNQMTLVATHSSHVMRGILEATNDVNVIRLSRSGRGFTGQRVESRGLMAALQKPSTKSEAVLDGLFADGVSVVESEGDRLVYGTVWDRLSSKMSHDMHFIPVGGLGGFPDPSRLYNTLKIPVCAILDLDAISQFDTFKNILDVFVPSEKVIGILGTCKKIAKRVLSMGPVRDLDEVKVLLKEIAESKLDWRDEDQVRRARKELSDVCGDLSPTARLKNIKDNVKEEKIREQINKLVNELSEFGVFLVPVGHLEDWVPDLLDGAPSRKRKSEWSVFAATKLRETDVCDGGIWDFVQQIADYQLAKRHTSSDQTGI